MYLNLTNTYHPNVVFQIKGASFALRKLVYDNWTVIVML